MIAQIRKIKIFIKAGRTKTLKLKVFIILTLGFILAGCNYKLREPVRSSENTTRESNETGNSTVYANTNTVTDEGDTGGKLILSDTGRTATIPCREREVEIEEAATANTITLTGECKKLIVDGVSNKIFVDKVGEIVIGGTSNKVIYGEGIGGKKPKISKSGTSTKVEQKTAEDANKNSASDGA